MKKVKASFNVVRDSSIIKKKKKSKSHSDNNDEEVLQQKERDKEIFFKLFDTNFF